MLALAIFWLLRLLRGTTAMPVVRGVGIVMVVVVVAGRLFDLEVINWLVENALAVLLIFILIVFQPEFRRALGQVGRAGRWSWLGMRRTGYDDLIEVVTTATMDLARRRTGALMVVERDTGLQEIVETGVRIDAVPTPHLLQGIFHPNTPLHDGAVVLRPDRVVAAACTLPLSQEGLGRGLNGGGMRHRAALGITERTDAVSVVVSEEDGAISLATDGRLLQNLDEQRLRSLLAMLLNGQRGTAAPAAAVRP